MDLTFGGGRPSGICGAQNRSVSLDPAQRREEQRWPRRSCSDVPVVSHGVQSELSFIIIALRRRPAQGCSHLATSAASVLSGEELQERQDEVRQSPPRSCRTQRSRLIRALVTNCHGTTAVQVFDGFYPISSFQTATTIAETGATPTSASPHPS